MRDEAGKVVKQAGALQDTEKGKKKTILGMMLQLKTKGWCLGVRSGGKPCFCRNERALPSAAEKTKNKKKNSETHHPPITPHPSTRK